MWYGLCMSGRKGGDATPLLEETRVAASSSRWKNCSRLRLASPAHSLQSREGVRLGGDAGGPAVIRPFDATTDGE